MAQLADPVADEHDKERARSIRQSLAGGTTPVPEIVHFIHTVWKEFDAEDETGISGRVGALNYLLDGRPDEFSLLEKLAKAQPKDAAIPIRQAELRLAEGKVSEAIALIAEAQKKAATAKPLTGLVFNVLSIMGRTPLPNRKDSTEAEITVRKLIDVSHRVRSDPSEENLLHALHFVHQHYTLFASESAQPNDIGAHIRAGGILIDMAVAPEPEATRPTRRAQLISAIGKLMPDDRVFLNLASRALQSTPWVSARLAVRAYRQDSLCAETEVSLRQIAATLLADSRDFGLDMEIESAPLGLIHDLLANAIALGNWREDPSDIIARTRMHYHRWFKCYRPDTLIFTNLKVLGTNEQASHLAALSHLLHLSFGTESEKRDVLLENLLEYTRTEGGDRVPLLYLAGQKLREEDWQGAIKYAQEALNSDSRCLLSQSVVTHSLAQLGQKAKEIKGIPPSFKIDLTERFCHIPFTTAAVNPGGDVHQCCALMVPVRSGNIYDDTNWDDIWNSEAAQEVRKSIHDGSFRYCSRVHCHLMNSATLPKRETIKDPWLKSIIDNATVRLDGPVRSVDLGHDETCQLSCPQCRIHLLVAKGKERQRLEVAKDTVILPLLENVEEVIITNGGDPFASRHYRQILRAIDKDVHSNLESIVLITNGLLFTEREWDELENIHHLDIKVAVSIDAARPDTYASVRRRGDFHRLRENLEFIAGLRRAGKISQFEIRFVTQIENFREMPEFVALGQELDVDVVVFTKLANVGTYRQAEYAERAICEPEHPRHQEVINVLKTPIMRWGRVHFTNLEPLFLEANGALHLGDARCGIRSALFKYNKSIGAMAMFKSQAIERTVNEIYAAWRARDLDRAEAIFDAAIDYDPKLDKVGSRESRLRHGLAIGLAHLGRLDEAVQFMEESGLRSTGDFGGIPYYAHVDLSLALKDGQSRRMKEGVPGGLVVGLAGSSNQFLVNALADLVGLPILRSALMANAFQGRIVPSWLKQAVPGGCVVTDRFDASSVNLDLLREHRLDHTFLVVRDPREAAYETAARQLNILQETVTDADIAAQFLTILVKTLEWLNGWQKAIESGLDCRIVRFSDLRDDPIGQLSAALSLFETDPGEEALKNYVGVARDDGGVPFADLCEQSSNWRSILPESLQAEADALVSADLVKFFSL